MGLWDAGYWSFGPVGTEGQRQGRGVRGGQRGRRGAQAGYGVVPQRLLQGSQRRSHQDGHQRPDHGKPAVRRREWPPGWSALCPPLPGLQPGREGRAGEGREWSRALREARNGPASEALKQRRRRRRGWAGAGAALLRELLTGSQGLPGCLAGRDLSLSSFLRIGVAVKLA